MLFTYLGLLQLLLNRNCGAPLLGLAKYIYYRFLRSPTGDLVMVIIYRIQMRFTTHES